MSVRVEELIDETGDWSSREIDEEAFRDVRLGRRCAELVRCLGASIGSTIPLACQDWANTKAAYRFLANPKVDEGDILGGHFAATRQRSDLTDGPILLVQDTTEFNTSAAIQGLSALPRASTVGETKRDG